MHTYKMNAQKTQLDSLVFTAASKARGAPTSEKKQRLSVGRNR